MAPTWCLALLLAPLGVSSIACSSSSSGAAPSSLAPKDASAVDVVPLVDAPSSDVELGSGATVTGPITGPGAQWLTAQVDLGALGYVEEEYFIEGEAKAFDYASPPQDDGTSSIKTIGTAHYKTRFLVRRPTDPSHFNGLVFVEWLNVSGGADDDPDFGYAHAELLRSGWAYVGISAQAVGIQGGGFSLGGSAAVPLVKWNPQRYGSLTHPGDSYSYDMYTQATRAVRSPASGAPIPLGPLRATKFVAAGESQSAGYMVTYADAIQPVSKMFDGIFIHSRFSSGSPLNQMGGTALPIVIGGSPTHIRGDLNIPVFQFLTETDVLGGGSLGFTGYLAARQPDTDALRTWEVAGTSHADQYLLDYSATLAPDAGSPTLGCSNINTGPQHWVECGAIAAFGAWLKNGTPPAKGDPLAMVDGGSGYAKDSIGNTLGGVRTAAVDAPISVLSGQSSATSVLCALFGSTTPLSTSQLQSLYPTHDDYVNKVTAATNTAQQGGFIAAADVPLIIEEAQAAPVPQ
jgi:hypothetical protein